MCERDAHGKFVDRNAAIGELNRDYVFVSDPNNKDDCITQSEKKAEQFVEEYVASFLLHRLLAERLQFRD